MDIDKLRAALDLIDKHLYCQDNSCGFVAKKNKKGVGTNGGCRCIESRVPFGRASLVNLVRVCREICDENS